jgi:hypothetical protein
MASIDGHFGPISQNPAPELWAPLISVAIAKYQPAPSSSGVAPGPTKLLREAVPALIDTGSQTMVIDQSTAQELDLKEGRGSSILFVGRETAIKSFFTTLWFPEVPYWHTGDIPSGAFSSVPFKVILGWDFLRRFNLTLSRKHNLVRLDWIGE